MRAIFILLLTATTVLSKAQQITGSAKDESGMPLSGATVCLLKDSVVITRAATGANGLYNLSGIGQGNYAVRVSYVGYKPAVSSKFSLTSSDVTVPELKLSKIPASLDNVNVTARKPMVEVRADKTILNVEGTINAVGSNALELLRKFPGVLLDKDDNISLSGKNGVLVYIDNRQVPLTGPDLANYLKSLQSSQIEAIELITNPPAKYDAAGNAGIINIRLVKNKSLGTNGSVNAGWNIGIHAKYNAGFSLNYRNKKINLFSTYSYSDALDEETLELTRNVLDTLFNQYETLVDLRQAHNLKIGADYFLDKTSTLGVMVNGLFTQPGSTSNGRTDISNTRTGIVDRVLIASNTTNMKRQNANLNINYNYSGANGKSLSVNADRGSYVLRNDQFQPNEYFDASGQTKLSSAVYHMLSPADITINSIKADYEQNLLKGKLGLGAKSAWVKTDNDFRRYDVFGTDEEFDSQGSNHFIYKENINAGYLSYNRQYKKLMIQAGLRVENTVSEGISNDVKYTGATNVPDVSSFRRSYTDFFPSAAITFNKNPQKPWSLNYSRRIDRPAYQDLNPFEFKLDEYTFMKGNINLRPQYTTSIGIARMNTLRMNMSVTYSHVKDMFTQIIDTVDKSKAFGSKKNLATQDIVNATLSWPFQYKSYSLFTSVSSNYSIYKADFGAGRKVNLDAFGFNFFMQNSVKLCKTWAAEVSGFYNAPTIYMGSFKGKAIYSVDAGLSKQLMKGRAIVKTSVSDLFRTMRFRATSNFAGQLVAVNFRPESRQLKLSFSYRFGSTTVKAARQRTSGAEEELKRVQQGGGILGNN